MTCTRRSGPRVHTGYVIDGYEHILLKCLEPFTSLPRALETGKNVLPIPGHASVSTSLTAAVLDTR